MKNWFNNLEDKCKLYLVIGLWVGTCIFAGISSYIQFFAFIYVIGLGFSIMFTVFYVQYKKSTKNNNEINTQNKDLTTNSYEKEDVVANTNSTTELSHAENIEKLYFNSNVLLRDYSNERIENLIKEDIENQYLTKEDLYCGYSNNEIEDFGKTYQLENYSMACDIEPFEDSYKFGVYLKNITGSKLFVGYLPDEQTDDMRKISLFGTIIHGGAKLVGGKYKEYDYEKEKIVIKKEDYEVEVSLTYSLEDGANEKMKNILIEEQKEAEQYKIIKTYIAGITYDNEDGSSRKDIANNLKEGALLHLEKYFYENNKAVKILTEQNKQIGHIPANLASSIFDYIENEQVAKVEFTPHYYDGRISDYNVKIFIKK